MEAWDERIGELQQRLGDLHRAREMALGATRGLIQAASKAIRALHRNERERAQTILEQGWTEARAVRAKLEAYPQILYAGYLQDAEKELVEATALECLIHEARMPSIASLGVEPASFANGVAEAASEGRRYMLDLMRRGHLEEAERMLGCMDAIYDDLITLDFPDGVTGGLRRTCDALRAVIERSRSDLTTTMLQSNLMNELKRR